MVQLISWDPGIKDLAFTIIDNKEKFQIKTQGIIDISSGFLNELYEKLEKNSNIFLNSIDKVVIEHQPNIGKCDIIRVDAALFMYYKSKGLSPEFMEPREKFKPFGVLIPKGKKNYNKRKTLSIKICKENLNIDLTKIPKHSQDDISDTILQAYAYLTKNKFL